MSVDIGSGRKLRLVSGSIQEVEDALNALLPEYFMQSITYTVVADRLVATALLIHAAEIRKMQLAMMPGQGIPKI